MITQTIGNYIVERFSGVEVGVRHQSNSQIGGSLTKINFLSPGLIEAVVWYPAIRRPVTVYKGRDGKAALRAVVTTLQEVEG